MQKGCKCINNYVLNLCSYSDSWIREELVHKTIPETPFQPPLSFSGSNIAKSMTKSLKLTKNLPIVRNSPMSHLFLAKNLAAWELSIKNTVVTSKDDIPPGWRTIEPIAEEQT